MTIPELVIRTTADNPGYAHSVVIGAGSSVDEAMADLLDKARRQAEEIALVVQDQQTEQVADAEWPFEVIGMRLATSHVGGQREAWLAYGTLVSAGRTPCMVCKLLGPNLALALPPARRAREFLQYGSSFSELLRPEPRRLGAAGPPG